MLAERTEGEFNLQVRSEPTQPENTDAAFGLAASRHLTLLDGRHNVVLANFIQERTVAGAQKLAFDSSQPAAGYN